MKNDSKERLQWQCRRGMRELDEMLQGFLDGGYEDLNQQGQHSFEQLLKYQDAVLLDCFMGRMMPMDKDIADVVARIRATAQNRV